MAYRRRYKKKMIRYSYGMVYKKRYRYWHWLYSLLLLLHYYDNHYWSRYIMMEGWDTLLSLFSLLMIIEEWRWWGCHDTLLFSLIEDKPDGWCEETGWALLSCHTATKPSSSKFKLQSYCYIIRLLLRLLMEIIILIKITLRHYQSHYHQINKDGWWRIQWTIGHYHHHYHYYYYTLLPFIIHTLLG